MQGSGVEAAAGIITFGPGCFFIVDPGFPEKKMVVVGHGKNILCFITMAFMLITLAVGPFLKIGFWLKIAADSCFTPQAY
jgi:hypothetical protein